MMQLFATQPPSASCIGCKFGETVRVVDLNNFKIVFVQESLFKVLM